MQVLLAFILLLPSQIVWKNGYQCVMSYQCMDSLCFKMTRGEMPCTNALVSSGASIVLHLWGRSCDPNTDKLDIVMLKRLFPWVLFHCFTILTGLDEQGTCENKFFDRTD